MSSFANASSAVLVGSIAIGFGSDLESQPAHEQQPHGIPIVDFPADMRDGPKPAELMRQLTGDCAVAPRQWLSFIPTRFEVCSGATYYVPTLGQGGSIDVNGDGAMDFVVCLSQFEPVWSGQPNDLGDIASSSMVVDVGGTFVVRNVPVFRPGTAVGSAIQSMFPGTNSARVYVIGWRDIDADSDLDLLTYMQLNPGSSSGQDVNCYFENIGYEKPAPPFAADLNRDGYVNGLDLGLLLGQWGPDS